MSRYCSDVSILVVLCVYVSHYYNVQFNQSFRITSLSEAKRPPYQQIVHWRRVGISILMYSEGESEASRPAAAAAPLVTASMTQILGSLETFDPTTDTVAAYVERAELFFAVNNIPAEKKVPVFLNAVGKQHYQLLANLFSPDRPASKPLAEIVATLKGHYEPKPIVIAERFDFHRRQQSGSETVAQYVAELRKLSVHCREVLLSQDQRRH